MFAAGDTTGAGGGGPPGGPAGKPWVPCGPWRGRMLGFIALAMQLDGHEGDHQRIEGDLKLLAATCCGFSTNYEM